MKKIGFFGGTFDPPHFGHLNLAIQLQEIWGLDEVLFCPTFVSPFKMSNMPHAGPTARKKMVELAIASIPNMRLCDIELAKGSACYTIDTIKELYKSAKEMGEKIQIHLLLGEDHLNTLEKWKEIDELLEIAPPLIGTRRDRAPGAFAPLSESIEILVKKGLVTIPSMDISSTVLRERLRLRLFCGHLIPESVLDYIYSNKLYL